MIERARKAGFKSVNVDLIYGLPHQTVESFAQSIDTVVNELNPDRLAVFNFAHVPWMKKHQTLIKQEHLPAPDEKLEILKLAIEELTSRGYEFIGMDHFARPDDELSIALKNGTLYRNFQGYNTHSEAEVIAIGATSISQLQRAYSQNVKTDQEYIQLIAQNKFPVERGILLTHDDLLRRKVITELMCNNVVYKKRIEEEFDIEFDQYFRDSIRKLQEFIQDGLLTLQDDKIQVEQTGRLVVRNIAMAFDAYIEEDLRKQKQMYSRTV